MRREGTNPAHDGTNPAHDGTNPGPNAPANRLRHLPECYTCFRACHHHTNVNNWHWTEKDESSSPAAGRPSSMLAAVWERSDEARRELESLLAALRSLPLPWPLQQQPASSSPRQQQHKHNNGQGGGDERQRRVNAAMQAAAVVDGVEVWRTRLLGTASIIQFGGLAAAAVSAMSPQGPGCSDFNSVERVANVVTSLPYAAVGLHSMRQRRTAAGKLWGASLLGVSAASATFHASRGRWRDAGRKADYWAIALSSSLLTRALYARLPPAATAACVAATPFRPFLVSAGNAMAMEAAFLQRALDNPDLRGPQKLHSAACVAGMALFIVEDASVPHVPFVHASWHCLSALSTGFINCLLADAEAQHPELTLDALQPRGRGKQQQQQQQQQQQRKPSFELAPLGLQADGRAG